MALLTLLISIALAATVAALGAGIVSMAHGGDFDERNATRLMVARVAGQALTLVLLIVALFLAAA
jgi:hypothetical protein